MCMWMNWKWQEREVMTGLQAEKNSNGENRKKETKEWKREEQIHCREKCVKIRERGGGKIINFTTNVVVSDGTKDDHHRQLCSFWLFIKISTMMHFCWTNFFLMSIFHSMFSRMTLSPSLFHSPFFLSHSLSLSLRIFTHSFCPSIFSQVNILVTSWNALLQRTVWLTGLASHPVSVPLLVQKSWFLSVDPMVSVMVTFFPSFSSLFCASHRDKSLSRLISIQGTFFLFPSKTPLVEMKNNYFCLYLLSVARPFIIW